MFTTYIPVLENSANITDIEVECYYSLGGANCFTGRPENRGYYLRAVPVERRGYMISFGAFTGVKDCIKPVARKSAKAELEADALAREKMDELVDYVLKKNGLVRADRAA